MMDSTLANGATTGDLVLMQPLGSQPQHLFDLSHGLCSREHNPCNVPGLVMCPSFPGSLYSRWPCISQPHNVTGIGASSAGRHQSARLVSLESSLLGPPG